MKFIRVIWFELVSLYACNMKVNVKQVCYVTPRPTKIEASHVLCSKKKIRTYIYIYELIYDRTSRNMMHD